MSVAPRCFACLARAATPDRAPTLKHPRAGESLARRELRSESELNLDDDAGALVSAYLSETAVLFAVQAQLHACASSEVAPP